METLYTWIVLLVVLLFLFTKRFRLTNTEFMIVFSLLMLILITTTSNKETFEIQPATTDDLEPLKSLYNIPTYANEKIGGSLTRLIEDTTKQPEKNDTEEVYSKESLQNDPDILLPNKKDVDPEKFALIRREYTTVNNMFLKMKELLPKEYERIFDLNSK